MLGALFSQPSEEPCHHGEDGQPAVLRCKDVPQKNFRKPPDPRGETGFVGLDNQGATCYLNSLIQVLFMIPEFRAGLYSIDPSDLGFDLVKADQEEQRQNEKRGIIRPDDQLVEAMMNMGFEEKIAKCALLKSVNNLEKAFEIIDSITSKDIKAFEKQHGKSSARGKPRYIPLELQRLFVELQHIDQSSISTEDLTSKGFQWQSAEGRVQHDAHELNRLLLEAVEKSLKTTSAQNLCQSLFTGSLVNQVLCLECRNISERKELFSDLNLQVSNCSDFVTAIDQFCGREILSGESAYQCDNCRRRTTACRSTVIEKCPEYLTISCNRFKIDRSTNWQRVKVTAMSEYPLVMELSTVLRRYNLQTVINDDALLPKSLDRVHDWVASTNGKVGILKDQMLWIGDLKEKALQFVRAKLRGTVLLPCDSKFLNNDHQCHSFTHQDLLDFRKLINFQEFVSSAESDTDKCCYILHSIIVHQGSAYSGHYYAYIRDNQNQGNRKAFESSSFMDLLKKSDECPNIDNDRNEKKIINNLLSHLPLYYFAESSNGDSVMDCWVSDNGALGHVLSAYLSLEKKLSQGITPFKHKRIVKKSTNSVFSVTIDQLCKEFSDLLGISWDNLHRKEFGRLEHFVKDHEKIFVPVEAENPISTSINKRSNRYIVSQSINIKIVSEVDFVHVLTSYGKYTASNTTKAIDKDIQPNCVEPLLSDNVVSNLAESLLREVFGCYFEFNDQNISPLSYSSIKDSFEGINSAYLLVYKRIPSYKDSLSQSTHKQSPDVAPPSLWLNMVMEKNRDIAKAREIYRELTSKVTIGFLLEEFFNLELPLLKLKPCNGTENPPPVEDLVILLECSSAWTIREALLVLTSSLEFSQRIANYPGQYPEKDCIDRWNVSGLDVFGENSYGYYPRDIVDHSALVGNSFQNGNIVLLWKANDEKVCSTSVSSLIYCKSSICYGELCRPVPIKVRSYSIADFPIHRKRPKCFNTICEKIQTYYLPRNFLILDALKILSNCMKISFEEMSVHVKIPSFQDSSKMLSMSANGAGEFSADDINSRLHLLYESGRWILNTIPNGPTIDEFQTTLKDLWYLQELIIEDMVSRGLQNKPLIEKFDAFISDSISLKIIVNDDILKELQSDYKSEFCVQVSRRSTVIDLKEDIFFMIGGSDANMSILSNIHFRTGNKIGEDLVEEEKGFDSKAPNKKIHLVTLQQLELRSDQTLFMDYFSSHPCLKETIVEIRHHLFSSKSIELPTNIQIPCFLESSIRDFRDVVGQKILGLPEGWTKHDQTKEDLLAFWVNIEPANQESANVQICSFQEILHDFRSWRLRSTNWMGEPGDLLEEVNAAGQSNLMNSIDFQDGNVLYFETGPAPLANMVVLKIYGWSELEPEEKLNGSESCDTCNVLDKKAELKFDSIHTERLKFLPFLGELILPIASDLGQLYLDVAPLSINMNFKSFVIRELRSDSLPGRSFIRDLSWNSTNQPSLKKLGLKSGSSLVLQKLDSVPSNVTDRSFRLWLRRLSNPENSYQGNAIMSPSWPPHELIVQGGSCPMMGHLVRPILQLFPDIIRSELCIFRYNPVTAQWHFLECGCEGPKKNCKAYKADSNICNAPFNLRDGDVVAIFSVKGLKPTFVKGLRDCKPGTLASACIVGELWDICTPEDVLLRSIREQQEISRKKNSKTVSSGKKTASAIESGARAKKPNHHSVEKGLVIKIDDLDN